MKKVLCAPLALLIVLSLAACESSGDSTGQEETTTKAPAETVADETEPQADLLPLTMEDVLELSEYEADLRASDFEDFAGHKFAYGQTVYPVGDSFSLCVGEEADNKPFAFTLRWSENPSYCIDIIEGPEAVSAFVKERENTVRASYDEALENACSAAILNEAEHGEIYLEGDLLTESHRILGIHVEEAENQDSLTAVAYLDFYVCKFRVKNDELEYKTPGMGTPGYYGTVALTFHIDDDGTCTLEDYWTASYQRDKDIEENFPADVVENAQYTYYGYLFLNCTEKAQIKWETEQG